MSSGMKTGSYPVDSAANPLGWRVVNGLAIAAPYLLAAALSGVLYLQPSSPAPAQAAVSAQPAPAADLPTSPGSAAPPVPTPDLKSATAAPGRSAAPAPGNNGAPVPAKSVSPAASISATPAAAAAASKEGASSKEKDEPLPTQPVPVDPAIAGTMKLSGDPPSYPGVARNAGIQGIVVLSATIGPDGTVQSVEPVSGPPLLEIATLTAVRSWRYRPYLIYGKPISFRTQIIITFKLDEPPQ